jgi:hypothetical protein
MEALKASNVRPPPPPPPTPECSEEIIIQTILNHKDVNLDALNMLHDIIPPDISKEEEDAAIKIQSLIRGVNARKDVEALKAAAAQICDKYVTITNETVLDVEKNENDIKVLDNYKDALLASLYSQVEFLRNEIEEKNLLIRKLIINDQQSSIYSEKDSLQLTSEYIITSEYDGDKDVDNAGTALLTQPEIEIELQQRINIEKQLTNVRTMKHKEFTRFTQNHDDLNTSRHAPIDRGFKPSVLIKDGVEDVEHNNHLWPQNTCLIVGDSILNNLDETKLNKKNKVVKVRAFPGSSIGDMFSYIQPLIRKKTAYIILHVGTNDAPHKSADAILDELLRLKSYILKHLPNCKIALSQPTIRNDNSRAKDTIRNLINKLDLLNIQTIDNRNIELEQLGRRGLHLNKWGTSKLAMNYISFLRGF